MTDPALIEFTEKLDKYNDLEVEASSYEAIYVEHPGWRLPPQGVPFSVKPEITFAGIAPDGTHVHVIVSVCPDKEHKAICLSLRGTCTVGHLREHLRVKGICACPPSEES